MENQGVIEFLNDRLQLNIGVPRTRCFMRKWRDLAERVDHLRKDVNIALVGKYTKLEDSYASVTKALQHAAIESGYKLNLKVECCNYLNIHFMHTRVICTCNFTSVYNYCCSL